MADNYKGSSKLVDSDYLYRALKSEDKRRADKLDKALFTTIPAHYEKTDNTNPNALEVIADGTGASSTQIELSNVTPVLDSYAPSVGDYVVFVDETKEDIYLKQADLIMETEELDLWGDVEPTGVEPIPDEELNALYNDVYNSVFGTN